MEKFKVYWKEQCIGTLCINGERYKYVPDQDAIKAIGEKAFLVREVITEYDADVPIQFFKQMIDNCSRFEGRGIGYHNNNYSLRKE